jgi:hypothetical protein
VVALPGGGIQRLLVDHEILRIGPDATAQRG